MRACRELHGRWIARSQHMARKQVGHARLGGCSSEAHYSQSCKSQRAEAGFTQLGASAEHMASALHSIGDWAVLQGTGSVGQRARAGT